MVIPCQGLKACPEWRTSDWMKCSTTCGQGFQRRRVYCDSVNTNELNSGGCSIDKKPVDYQTCNLAPCPLIRYDWRVTNWTEVSDLYKSRCYTKGGKFLNY